MARRRPASTCRLDVAHDEACAAIEDDLAMVASLTAGFGIEGRHIEDEFGRTGRQRIDARPTGRDGDQLALAFSAVIAGEFRGACIIAHAKPDIVRCLIAG